MSQPAKPSTMPTMVHWSELYAFGLPAGSVRAILSLAILGTTAALIALHPTARIPDAFRDLTFLILGHYYALRRSATEERQIGPSPLFLPPGTVRLLILLGFAAVVVYLYMQHELFDPRETPAVYTMIVVAGFLFGVICSTLARWLWKRGRRPKRIWADIRAALVLLAAAALIVWAWNEIYHFMPTMREQIPRPAPITAEGFRHTLGAIVAFYFGARS